MRPFEPSQEELRALWESGVPLDSAWVRFAKFFDQFMLMALRTHPANDESVLAGHPRYKELGSWLPPAWETRQKKLVSTTRNERINLLGQIYSGDLWAIGFRTLPNGSDEFARVPRQHFFFDQVAESEQQPDIHWSKGELTVGHTSYFDIHVLRAPQNANAQPANRDSGIASAPTGEVKTRAKPRVRKQGKIANRKKLRHKAKTSPEIARVARRLWRTDPEFRRLPIKGTVPEVRAAILGEARKDEEASGYRFSSMAKIIGRAIAPLRKRKIRKIPN